MLTADQKRHFQLANRKETSLTKTVEQMEDSTVFKMSKIVSREAAHWKTAVR